MLAQKAHHRAFVLVSSYGLARRIIGRMEFRLRALTIRRMNRIKNHRKHELLIHKPNKVTVWGSNNAIIRRYSSHSFAFGIHQPLRFSSLVREAFVRKRFFPSKSSLNSNCTRARNVVHLRLIKLAKKKRKNSFFPSTRRCFICISTAKICVRATIKPQLTWRHAKGLFSS